MSIRVKSRRRLLQVTIAVGLIAGLGAGGYFFRLRQIESRVVRNRAEGTRAFKEGDYELALHKIGTYVQRHPEDADALLQYAEARERVPSPNGKHIGEAISLYRQFRGLRPGDPQARRKLLDLYTDHGFSKEAIDVAAEILRENPKDLVALRARSRSLARLRQFDEAFSAASAYLEQSADDLEMQSLTLQIIAAQGKSGNDVVGYASERLKEHPNDARFELLLSSAYAMAGNRDKAQEYILLAAPHGPEKDPVYVKLLVGQLEALQLFDESMRVLDRVADVGGAEISRLYVSHLWQSGRPQEVADRLRALDPADKSADSELLAVRAMALFRLGHGAEAAAITDTLSKRFDSTAEAWAGFLKVSYAQPSARPRDVIRTCKQSLGQIPNSAYFHDGIAHAYAAVGETDLAEVHWQQAARLAPFWAVPPAKLAESLLASGRVVDAYGAAIAAKSRAPEDVDALLPYAHTLEAIAILEAKNSSKEARDRRAELNTLAAKIYSLRPQNDATVVMKVIADGASGRKDEAATAARAAVASDKTPAEATLLRLASASRDLGLGLEKECYDRSEKLYGLTPTLASVRSRALLAAGKAAEGRALLQDAMARPNRPGDEKGWRSAWASYLELSGDVAASKDAVIKLADALPDDPQIQAAALRSIAAREDIEFAKRATERLRAATGEDAVAWRLARARLLLQEAEKKQKGNNEGTSQELTQAAAVLGDATRAVPELDEPRVLLAACLERLGNRREAIDQLTTVVNRKPGWRGPALDLARLLQAEGDSTARTYLDRVAADPAATPQDRIATATMLAQAGDTGKAITVLNPAPSGDGRAAPMPPTLLLARLYTQQHDTEKAKGVYRAILEKTPDLTAIALLADLVAAEGRADEAEQLLRNLDQSGAKPGVKELVRGRYHAVRGESDKALAEFEAATKAAPGEPKTWQALARLHLSNGNLAAATDAAAGAARASVHDDGLEAMVQTAPLLPKDTKQTIYFNLLASLVETPSPDAKASVPEAIKVLAAAEAKGQKGDGEQTATRLEEIAHQHPKVLPVQLLAAQVCAGSKRAEMRESAATIATRAMETFPGAAEPAQLATLALSNLGRWPEVVSAARQWAQRAPSAAAQADAAAARAYIAQGDFASAARALEPHVKNPAVGQKQESNATVAANFLYAQALVGLRRTEEAEKLLSPRLPDSPMWRNGWMQLATQLPDSATGARWLERVEPLLPDAGAEERVNLAQAWTQLAKRTPGSAERARKALASATRAIDSADQPNIELVLMLGSLLDSIGDTPAAETAYKRVLAARPDNALALNNLVMVLVNRGEIDDQLTSRLATAAQKQPNAGFYDTLGTVQAKSQKYTDAVASLSKAVDLAPDRLTYRIHLASLLMRDGQTGKSAEAYQELSRADEAKLTAVDRQRLKDLREALATQNGVSNAGAAEVK